ncbi:MAG: hypothetical protein IBJ18_01715 [Phycisphaerales bacterium]|nr:hypothetical protein [Phycisphaerales bacterium]
MKMQLYRLAVLAGGLVCCSAASAQWVPSGSPFAGPYTVVGTGGFFQSINLGGESAPAGSYWRANVTALWSGAPGSTTSLWQNDSKMSLTNAPVNGVAAVPSGVTVHFGTTTGTAPTTGVNSNTTGTIRYDNINLVPTFVAGNPLHMAFRTSFTSGGNFTWSNITVSLTPTPPAPVNETCATAIDVSAGANAALTGPFTNFIPPAQEIGGANPSTIAPSPFSCQATVSRATWYAFTPSASAAYIVGSCTSAGLATQNTMVNNVVALFDGTNGCASLSSLACTTTTCSGGVQSSNINLNAGTTYYIALARTGTTALAATELKSQIFISRADQAICGANVETEPNDTAATANSFTLNLGDTICGTSTGSGTSGGGLTSGDTFRIKTAAHPGIRRNRIRVASSLAGHTLIIRGLSQSAGVIGTSESDIQTSNTATVPTRMVQWYTLGNSPDANDRSINLRVTGTTSTTAQYSLNYIASDEIVPTDLARTIRPGSLVITSVGQTTTDTDLWIYDANLNPIANFGNDDEPGTSSTQSRLTRTFNAGTYYIAISRFNLANNQPAATDDDFKSANVLPFPGTLVRGGTFPTLPLSLNFKVTDSEGDVTQSYTVNDAFEVAFFKMTVAPAPSTGGCNPADIACDDGTPLAAAPGCTNSTTGPNEGDYNAFFAADGFFFQSGQGPAGVGGTCDIACDDGTALSQAPGCTNNGVNEGDYNCFFNNLFLSCI